MDGSNQITKYCSNCDKMKAPAEFRRKNKQYATCNKCSERQKKVKAKQKQDPAYNNQPTSSQMGGVEGVIDFSGAQQQQQN